MVKCKFSDVSERDMDLLFLEEFVYSADFLNIFLSKVDLVGATVCEVEQSKVDVEFGESDMTVIVEKDEKKYGLLIEDKIDAIAMSNQSGRYVERGKIGVNNGDYEEYYVFIVAPKEYLLINEEAKKYPNQVTYEECLDYFCKLTDNRSAFKVQQIEQAIHKQKHGYQVIENKAVTSFWREYAKYQKAHHPELIFRDGNDPKGANSTWIAFHTNYKKIKIFHKSERGFVDLEFAGLGQNTAELKKLIIKTVGKLWTNNLAVYQTGKSAVLRIRVPEIDFKSDFAFSIEKVEQAMIAAEKLYSILDEIPEKDLNELFEMALTK